MIVKDVIKQVAINLGLNDLLETTALDGEQTITEEEQCLQIWLVLKEGKNDCKRCY